MAQELIEETMKDIGTFMQNFAVTYTMTLVNVKVDGAIADGIKGVVPTKSDPNEEKKLEDKEATKPIAAGVMLISYKQGAGADQVERRFYDIAAWSIKPQDSVITNATYRHYQLLNLFNSMKKRVPAVAGVAFPQKKKFGKKDDAFYRERFGRMQKYYDTVSRNPKVSTDTEWLKFFKLQYDAAAVLRIELFTKTLQTVCKKESIDWNYAFDFAQRMGISDNQAELLKIVAIEKVGRDAAAKVNEKVLEVAPGFIPESVKTKMANSAEAKLFVAIGTTVETAWKGIEVGFNKVADSMNTVMDQAVGPLKKMFEKVLGPCKDFVASKLKKIESDEKDEIDNALRRLKATRFPPIKEALAALGSGASAADTCRKTMARVCDLEHTWKYATYLQYPEGNAILEWFPPIENIMEKHNQLVVAMLDVVYVLGRGLCRALEPLCEYVDKDYDEKKHEEEVAKAVWAGGKRLALDFFSLPQTTWKACSGLGPVVTKQVVSFCRQTVNLEADVLGTVAATWKPTSKSDAKAKFQQALSVALDAFIGERAFALASLLRDGSVQLVSNLFIEMFGETVTEIGSALDDLVKELPQPLNDLKPGDIITSIFKNLVAFSSFAAVKRWASATERYLVDPNAGSPPSWKEEMVAKFRKCAPKIRNDNDDNSKPEINEEDKKRKAAAKAKGGAKKEKKEKEKEEKEEKEEEEKEDKEEEEQEDGGEEQEDGGEDGGGEDEQGGGDDEQGGGGGDE